MSTLGEKLNEFVKVEQEMGISLKQYREKFVFNSNSGPDAIYLDINQPSPSQLLGMNKTQQSQCIMLMTEMIFKAGEMLKLPVSTTIVTVNIAQYYFTRKSFLQYDFRDIAMGAMFLACKSEETLRRSYQIAAVFDYVFKMYEGQRAIRELELNSNEYNYMKEKVLKTENEILFQLGFEVYKLFDIPHRYISGLIMSFNKHKQCNTIVQYSWTFLNDIYRTKAAVFFPGQVIAAASVFMALQKLKIPMPEKPWWILMEASIQQIKQICVLTNEIYETSNKNEVNINKVSQILQRVGKQRVKVSNVLPVPYYRKIRLQSQGLVMKSIQPEKLIPIVEQKNQNSKIAKNSESDDQKKDEERYRQKSKKEKKKDKKKNKNHKRDERSKSSSQEKHKIKEKGKYQNDNQTPKIKKPDASSLVFNGDNTNLVKAQQKTLYPSETVPQRKASDLIPLNSVKEPVPQQKKSALLDAKSLLSKFSLQSKKTQVKNKIVTVLNDKKQESTKAQNGNHENIEQKEDKVQFQKTEEKQKVESQSKSDSDDEDELLAELIKIKKKNLQKKEELN